MRPRRRPVELEAERLPLPEVPNRPDGFEGSGAILSQEGISSTSGAAGLAVIAVGTALAAGMAAPVGDLGKAKDGMVWVGWRRGPLLGVAGRAHRCG